MRNKRGQTPGVMLKARDLRANPLKLALSTLEVQCFWMPNWLEIGEHGDKKN